MLLSLAYLTMLMQISLTCEEIWTNLLIILKDVPFNEVHISHDEI